MKYEIDYEGLRKYLINYKYRDFKDGIVLEEAHTEREINFFNMDTSSLKKEQIIKQGQPFLVDYIGNDLSIVFAMNRKYKNTKGRMVYAKFHKTIIFDCGEQFGSCLNGYWMIPSQFVKKLK